MGGWLGGQSSVLGSCNQSGVDGSSGQAGFYKPGGRFVRCSSVFILGWLLGNCQYVLIPRFIILKHL